ncbi:MAG: D-amino acid dehydrogenase [Moraxella sp.]
MLHVTNTNNYHHKNKLLPKKITVLGAGVTGVTTAWYLTCAGFDVTVIDRKSAAALETSFANGGQISVCHATPWANPATPLKAFKWLGQKEAPLLFHLSTNFEQWQFIWRFLGQCRSTLADKNLVQMVNLGLYSRAALKTLITELSLNFSQRLQGILHFYTNQQEYQAAFGPTKRMSQLGCYRQIITPKEAINLEPSLAILQDKLVGATFTNDDLSGNAHIFTQELTKHCQKAGVTFLFDTHIKQIYHKNNLIDYLCLESDCHEFTHQSDAYVVCLASFGKQLLDPIGVYLPIFPAKGYSATFAVKDASGVPQISLIDDEYKLVMSRFTNPESDVLRVAGTAEFHGYDTQLTLSRCQALTKRTQSLFGEALDYQTPNYWTGLRPMTPSNVPLIGRAHFGKIRHGSTGRLVDNLWLNTGHGTLGFTHACGSAKALSLLIQNQKPDFDFQFVGY